MRRWLTYLMMLICAISYGVAQEVDSIPVQDVIRLDSLSQSTRPKPTDYMSGEITPVDIDRDKPRQPVMHYYDKHGNQLETPVRFLAELDTVTTSGPKAKYPAYNGVSVSFNFFDAIMKLAGQQRENYSIAVDVSLWNWIFPVVELGIGKADAHPNDGRCHITTSPTLYGKIGFDYNFLYKSNPDYQLMLGFRAGYTKFNFSVSDIQAGSDYYDVADGKSLWGVRSDCWYGQIALGLKVKIWKGLYMGWSGRLGFKFKETTTKAGAMPWFVPGYGVGSMSAEYSIGYRF